MNVVICQNSVYLKQSYRKPDGKVSSRIVKKLGKKEDFTPEEITALRRKFSGAEEKEKELAEGAALVSAVNSGDPDGGDLKIPRPRMSYAMLISSSGARRRLRGSPAARWRTLWRSWRCQK